MKNRRKIKIKFNTPEEVAEFIKICNLYISDINIWDGHIVIDAKSIISVFSIANGKTVEVEIISNDESEIKKFIEEMNRYEIN